MAQVRALAQGTGKQRQTIGRGHENPNIAVLQDKADLLRFEKRIDWHEYAARRWRAETCDNRFEPLLQVDRDAIGTLQAQCHQPGAELADRRVKAGIRERRFFAGQGRLRRSRPRRIGYQVRQQK